MSNEKIIKYKLLDIKSDFFDNVSQADNEILNITFGSKVLSFYEQFKAFHNDKYLSGNDKTIIVSKFIQIYNNQKWRLERIRSANELILKLIDKDNWNSKVESSSQTSNTSDKTSNRKSGNINNDKQNNKTLNSDDNSFTEELSFKITDTDKINANRKALAQTINNSLALIIDDIKDKGIINVNGSQSVVNKNEAQNILNLLNFEIKDFRSDFYTHFSDLFVKHNNFDQVILENYRNHLAWTEDIRNIILDFNNTTIASKKEELLNHIKSEMQKLSNSFEKLNNQALISYIQQAQITLNATNTRIDQLKNQKINEYIYYVHNLIEVQKRIINQCLIDNQIILNNDLENSKTVFNNYVNTKKLEFKGEKGEQGKRGEKGEQGERGEKGEKGEQGERGVQGIRGEKGEKGEQGERGVQGIRGERGENGNIENVEITKNKKIWATTVINYQSSIWSFVKKFNNNSNIVIQNNIFNNAEKIISLLKYIKSENKAIEFSRWFNSSTESLKSVAFNNQYWTIRLAPEWENEENYRNNAIFGGLNPTTTGIGSVRRASEFINSFWKVTNREKAALFWLENWSENDLKNNNQYWINETITIKALLSELANGGLKS